jgi:hypothetical protein
VVKQRQKKELLVKRGQCVIAVDRSGQAAGIGIDLVILGSMTTLSNSA